jgi:hypothetical protein
MKIRNEFVSNSSSSSFVVFVPEELHLQVLEAIGKEYEEILSDLIDVYEVMGINWYKLHASESYGCTYILGGENNDVWGAWDEYEDKLALISKITGLKYLKHLEDM